MNRHAIDDIAQAILDGFDRHYRHFRQYSREGRACFEQADWARVSVVSKERIQGYDQRVEQTVEHIRLNHPKASQAVDIWPKIKISFIGKLMGHLQAECAETFYNSVACRVIHRDYYNNEYIFWRPAISTEHLQGSAPTYRSYYPTRDGLRRSLLEVLGARSHSLRFQHLRRDIRHLERAILKHRSHGWKAQPKYQIQVLDSLFYRNKAAYIVGRIVNGELKQPFVIPLLRDENADIFCDALLMRQKEVEKL